MPTSRNHLPQAAPWRRRTWVATLTALSFLTLLIHGYHPFAEDGGLYVAGVEYTLDPTLFPHFTPFVTEHLRFSIFAPLLAAAVHLTHLPLDWVLFLSEIFSLALTFVGAHQLLRRCISSEAAHLAGLALLAAWWTLPIAGTSLLLMDPYLTARSLSTPLTMLAIAFALDDWRGRRSALLSALPCLLTLAAAAVFHPLMAAYAAAFVLTLRAARTPRTRAAFTTLTLAALPIASLLNAIATPESPAVVAAAISRYYWFLSQWQWFEILGLAGPLIVLTLLLHYQRHALQPAATTLLRSCLFLGLLANLIALLFCHQDAPAHLVARLQPLRVFLPIYAIMTLLLGATLMQGIQHTRARTTLPILVFTTMACIFYYVQRQTYTTSPQVELPGRESHHPNPWVQAFLWARANTPPDALFALDARYINQDGEDAQTFRAWSLRSALPDFSKDGGEAAITPSLAPSWLPAATAQRSLSTESDADRDAQILPLGATWMILPTTIPTHHSCPYQNPDVKVCRLTP